MSISLRVWEEGEEGSRRRETHLEPSTSCARDDVALGVKEDELLARRRLHADEELLVLAELRVGAAVGDDHDAVGLADARLGPRRRDGRVGDVQDDAVLLLGLSEPAGELELAHAAEGVPAEDLHDGRLVEVRGRGADRLERLVQLDRKLGDGNVPVGRDDGDGLRRGRASAASSSYQRARRGLTSTSARREDGADAP